MPFGASNRPVIDVLIASASVRRNELDDHAVLDFPFMRILTLWIANGFDLDLHRAFENAIAGHSVLLLPTAPSPVRSFTRACSNHVRTATARGLNIPRSLVSRRKIAPIATFKLFDYLAARSDALATLFFGLDRSDDRRSDTPGLFYSKLLALTPRDRVTVRAKTDARMMILGGVPTEGPRYIW
jgi:hypothetical protein